MTYETYIDRGGRRLTSVGLAQARPNQHVRELPTRACVTDAYVDKGDYATNAVISLLIFMI